MLHQAAFCGILKLSMSTCPICGSPLTSEATICPTCGSPLERAGEPKSHVLPLGTHLLNSRYSIGKTLGQGGFGITYQGADTLLRRRVAIKELFPEGSARAGLDVLPPGTLGAAGFTQTKLEFIEEARLLAQFTHPGIVRVWDAFEEHRTGYLVMELLQGQDLGKRLESGPLTLEETLDLIMELAHALESVHAVGLLHRDIKPDNIFLNGDGRTVLIDFGSARTYAAGQTSSHTRLVTPGYAPPEQYASSAKFGPYTDIYAFAATLYHALSGVQPPPSVERMMGAVLPELPSWVPARMRDALERAAALRVDQRPQTVQEFLDSMGVLEGQGRAPIPAAPVNVPSTPVHPVPTANPVSPANSAPARRRSVGIGGSRALAQFPGNVFALTFSPDGGTLAVSACATALLGLCTRAEMTLWNILEDGAKGRMAAHSSAAYGLGFSGDGDLLASGGEDGRVRLWDPSSGEVLQEMQVKSAVSSVSFHPSGFSLALGRQNGAVLNWDLRASQAKVILERPGGWINALSYSPDGRYLALASGAKQNDGQPSGQLYGLQDQSLEGFALEGNPTLRSLAFSPDSSMLALGVEDGRIHLWDMNRLKRVGVLEGHGAAVRSLSFSSANLLASGSDDRTTCLWNPVKGQLLERFNGHTQEVTAVSYRVQGGVIASGGFDDRVLLWDVAALEGG